MNRLTSLDVFRGVTIAFMILVNNPGRDESYGILKHAPWHGWTPTDLVFPFFVWIVGVAMTLSFARRLEDGADRFVLLKHALRRGGLIFLIGFLLNLVPKFDFEHVRIMGVLQRIGLCYMIGSAIYLFTSVRGQMLATGVLLGGYWGLMLYAPVPGVGASVLDPDRNFAHWFDRFFLSGHMWGHTKTWDPEGLLSTFPAVGNVLLGAVAGYLLRAKRMKDLPPLGGALAILGLVCDAFFPINKALWSPSFVLLTCGLATMVFWLCWYVVDVKGVRAPFRVFEIFGLNALVAFVGSGILARILRGTGADDSMMAVYNAIASPANASLLYALTNVAIMFALAFVLWKRKIVVKL